MLLDSNYNVEARLKEHCFFDNKYIDVVIHSKINDQIKFRKPTLNDAQLYFDWVNDESVRSNSYNTSKIDFETHVNWFTSKLKDENCFMYLFQNESNEFIGQVRIQKQDDFSSIIGVSIDVNQRGKGYANKIIEIASNHFLSKNDKNTIDACIKEENIASAKGFEKAGFILKEMTNYENVKSFHYTKNAK
jgi:RimJ/RimL family protein N-acetyltransferase